MVTKASDFWRLAEQSQLLSAEQCGRWRSEFAKLAAGKAPTPESQAPQAVAAFLVGKNVLSKYQASVLMAGRPGPFAYGDYKVYDRVEKGRFAGMFRAVHATSGHPVLLQFVSGAWAQDPRAWATFQNEATLAGAIRSPQAQRVFQCVEAPGYRFVVLEDLRGQSLADRLSTSGRVAPSEACRIARQIAGGLAELHATGRVHGDVRPTNIWCDNAPAGTPANTRVLRDLTTPPSPIVFAQPDTQGRLAAIADFAAPELQFPGAMPNVLTDVYSLGCTLYCLLSGSPPFAGGDALQKMARHAAEPTRPLEAPPPIVQMVAYLMAKNPAIRYQDMRSIVEQLTPFVDPAALRVAPPVAPATLAAFESTLRVPSMPAPPAFPGANGHSANGHAPIVSSPGAPPPAAAAKDSSFVSTTASINKRAKKRGESKALLWSIIAGVAVIVVAGLAFWLRPSGDTKPTTKGTDKPTESGSQGDGDKGKKGGEDEGGTPGTIVPVEPEPTGPVVVPDDGKLLWASPTAGAPIAFRFVPPEAQVLFHLRPSSLLATREGPKLLKALGPELQQALEQFESSAGIKLKQVDRMLVTLHNNDGAYPRVAIVVQLNELESAKALSSSWKDVAKATEGAVEFFEGAGAAWSFYIPEESDGKTFVMGAAVDVREVIKSPDPGLRRMALLAKRSDDTRHATVLFYPNFLFNSDGEPLFQGPRERLRESLRWLLGDNLQVALFSLHCGESTYVELLARPNVDKDKHELVTEYLARFEKARDQIKEHFALRLRPPEYWALLAADFPAMVRRTQESVRGGVEGDESLFNCVLPPTAAHNLALGFELAVATTPGGGSSSVASTGGGYSGPKTVEETMTKLKIPEFSFDQKSLEFAIQELAQTVEDNLKGAPFKFEIKIMGKHLELSGVTRNQSVKDFKQVSATVGECLTALSKKASAELIWAYGPAEDDAKRTIIYMTTRTKAKEMKWTIPKEFE